MKTRLMPFLYVILALSVSAVMASTVTASSPSPTVTSQVYKDSSQSRLQLPILNVTPANGSDNVNSNAPIQITLDPGAPSFQRFKEQFHKGKYIVTLNNEPLQSAFDASNNQITAAHEPLKRFSTYTVTLTVKADANNSQNNAINGSYSFSFKTPSTTEPQYTILDPSTISPDILDRASIYPDEPYQVIVALVSKIGDGSEENPFRPWVEWAGRNLGWVILLEEGEEIMVKIYVPSS